MASILHSLAAILKRNEGRGGGSALLPSTAKEARRMDSDDAMLASDYLGQQYEELDYESIELDNVLTEEELAMQAYSAAKNQTYRDEVYESDFYRDLNARIPSQDTTNSIVWRVDIDHPVVVVLTDVLGQDPLHLISDVYGDQLIYTDHDVRTAIQYILELCQKYDLAVKPTPIVESNTQQPQENGFTEVSLNPEAPTAATTVWEQTGDNPDVTISVEV